MDKKSTFQNYVNIQCVNFNENRKNHRISKHDSPDLARNRLSLVTINRCMQIKIEFLSLDSSYVPDFTPTAVAPTLALINFFNFFKKNHTVGNREKLLSKCKPPIEKSTSIVVWCEVVQQSEWL